MANLEKVNVQLTLKVGIDYDPHDGLTSAVKKVLDNLKIDEMYVSSASIIAFGGTGGAFWGFNTSHNLKNLLKRGLIIDGGHHKQWFIEEALEMMGYDIKEIRKELEAEDFYAEEGIPP